MGPGSRGGSAYATERLLPSWSHLLPHQVGQLCSQVHEHVQLLLLVHALSAAEAHLQDVARA
eukprot:jgi/Mesen1/8670/ME000504S08107